MASISCKDVFDPQHVSSISFHSPLVRSRNAHFGPSNPYLCRFICRCHEPMHGCHRKETHFELQRKGEFPSTLRVFPVQSPWNSFEPDPWDELSAGPSRDVTLPRKMCFLHPSRIGDAGTKGLRSVAIQADGHPPCSSPVGTTWDLSYPPNPLPWLRLIRISRSRGTLPFEGNRTM